MEKAKQQVTVYEKQIEISKKETQRKNALALQQKEIQVQSNLKNIEIELKEKKASIEQSIKQEVARRDLAAQQD